MMVGEGGGGLKKAKAAAAAAARHHRPFIFLRTTFLCLLLSTITIIQAQDMWYVTWTPGSLCNKKPAGDFQSWEQSFPTLENCCTAKMSYDYDNCCNPTAPGLPTCTEEFCVDRTCANGGLCSKELGMCLCIPPFGLDSDGDCTATGGNNENQFASCEVDVDCPWWSDPLRLEKCDTGSDIPDGVTVLDWTREECCERHYPDSKFCNSIAVVVQGGGGGGGDDDDYVDLDMFELIPLKFFFGNLPDEEDGIDIDDLKEQVRIVLKDFLLNLSVRFTGDVEMGLSSIKETTRFNGLEKKNQLGGMDVYYDVKVVREPEQEFAPTIIEEVLDSFDDIVQDIQNKTTTDIYVNICVEDNGAGLTNNQNSYSPMGSLSSFNNCKLQPKEVTAKFRFKDLPQEIRNDAASFDDIKMVIMKAYKEMLGDGSIDGMMLLSVVDMGEVSYDDGTLDVQTNVVYEGENNGVAYPSAIGDSIALSRDIVLNRLQSSMGEYNWCTKEEGTLTVCAPGEKGITPFPVWGYILIGSSVGVIVLLCLCCFTGFGCAKRNIATGRSRKSEQINQLNMESYIVTGHGVHHDRRVKSRHFRSRNDRRYRLSFTRNDGERISSRRHSEKEGRRHSSHSRRPNRQPKRRRSIRKRSGKILDDSDNFSVSSFDPEKRESELVLYEGEQSQQQLVIYDEVQEEPQSRRPDPDGLVLQLDNDNNQILQLEAGGDDRLDTFRV